MCVAASSLVGDKYHLKKLIYNGDLYRSAERNTEYDRDLLVLVLFPEASHTDVCSFSWLLLNGVLVEWLQVRRQLDTDRPFWSCLPFFEM